MNNSQNRKDVQQWNIHIKYDTKKAFGLLTADHELTLVGGENSTGK